MALYDTEQDGLLHVPDNKFISFSRSVAKFIDTRMRELNPQADADDKLCLGCMATVLLDTAMELGAANLEHDKMTSEWLLMMANVFGEAAYTMDRRSGGSAKKQREYVATNSDDKGVQ